MKLIASFLFVLAVSGNQEINLAFVGPNGVLGEEWESAFKLSVELINEIADSHGSNISLNYTIHKTLPSCNTSGLVTTLLASSAMGVVGPARTDCAMSLSKGLGNNLTLISYSATGQQLSNKTVFPGFFRVCPSNIVQAKALSDLVKNYNWKKVNVIQDDGVYSSGLAAEFIRELANHGVTVEPYSVHNSSQVPQTIDQVQNSSNSVTIVLTKTSLAEELFLQAKDKGLMAKGKYWLGGDSLTVLNINNSTELKDALQGAVIISPSIGGTSGAYFSILARWLTKSKSVYPGKIWDSKFDVKVSSYVPHIYDAVYAYYKGFSDTKNLQNQTPEELRQEIANKLKSMNSSANGFDGAVGVPIFFDPLTFNGPPAYDILNLQDDNWEKVGSFYGEKLTIQRTVFWSGRNLNSNYEPPSSGESADEFRHLVVVLGVLLGIFVILTIVLYQFIQSYRKRVEIGHSAVNYTKHGIIDTSRDYIQQNRGAFSRYSDDSCPSTVFDEERKIEVTHL